MWSSRMNARHEPFRRSLALYAAQISVSDYVARVDSRTTAVTNYVDASAGAPTPEVYDMIDDLYPNGAWVVAVYRADCSTAARLAFSCAVGFQKPLQMM